MKITTNVEISIFNLSFIPHDLSNFTDIGDFIIILSFNKGYSIFTQKFKNIENRNRGKFDAQTYIINF
jgi:hypothetical protein